MADAKKKDLALLLAGKYTAADPVLEDGDVQYLRMDENGRLLLNAIVTAEVADSKIKGSPDGETWVPVKLDAQGNVMVKFPAAQQVTVSGSDVALPVDIQYHDLGGDPIPVVVQGNVETITVADAVAMRETQLDLLNIDVSKYKQIEIIAVSTLNKNPLTITLYDGPAITFSGRIRVPVAADISTVAKDLKIDFGSQNSSRTVALGGQIPELFHTPVFPYSVISMRITAEEAPTDGTLTIRIRGCLI